MSRPSRRTTVLLLVGIVIVAGNLRFALTTIGPLIDEVRGDLGLSAAAAGLLTTAPLLALGVVSPLAPRLAERWGAEHVVLGALLTLAAGVLLRLAAPVGFLFAGTILAGCAIAIGNVLMPAIIKRRFGPRAPFMTGFYTIGLSTGAALSAGLIVPLERLVGDWRIALAAWAVPALIGALVWLPQLRGRAGERREAAEARAARVRAGTPRVRLWRDRRAWAITLFMGLQSAIFYTASAWLPEILREQGVDGGTAGVLLAYLMFIGIPIGFVTTTLAGRMDDQRPLAVIATVTPALGWFGLIVLPQVTFVWVTLLGIGAGAGFPLVLTLFSLRARDVRHTAALSGMAQSVGYTIAAISPLALGALHDVTGSWTAPLVVMTLLGVPELIAAVAGSKPGFVGAEPGRVEAAAAEPEHALA